MENLFEFRCRCAGLEDAVRAGIERFDCRRTDLDVDIVTPARRGLFGLFGRRDAEFRLRIGNRLAAARIVLHRLLELAGFADELQLDINEGDNLLIIESPHNALIIGKKGLTLDSFEYLVNGIVDRYLPDGVRLRLDCGRFRQRQKENIRRLARELVEKARKTGRPVLSEPLPAEHRQIIHQMVKKFPDCTSRSQGQGVLKKVSISSLRK
ncbi:spoIIIJ-associated protein [Geothermobacter ehrlichii]|uniref:SpoIIIJ-associated protein n=1 Tax=Geothermobacter ehrlichii TaxID=213224 RepID=A0A5D3WLB6_9BACT|nr:R3H domain-containing nucleic acid-binding protein [Geothermobacter ehrlichii]TYO97664.1 spoIIIJ-associated protein [Geothermobacter ehrlichii]